MNEKSKNEKCHDFWVSCFVKQMILFGSGLKKVVSMKNVRKEGGKRNGNFKSQGVESIS